MYLDQFNFLRFSFCINGSMNFFQPGLPVTILWGEYVLLSDPSGTDLSLVFSSSRPVSDYYTIHFLKAHDISSPFFYFLTFEKADCSIFTLSVGWLVDVTINFFNMQFSAFFLFSNFRKGRLLYIHPVGRSVGWSVG